jgi:hypothetical protein
MANNVEWAYVDKDARPYILGPYEEAGDGNVPAGEEGGSSLHGVGVGDVVIYGEPQELISFFDRCVGALAARVRSRK